MTLDGKVTTGEAWDNVQWAELSYYDGKTPDTNAFGARFKVLWTDTAIYFLVDVTDSEISTAAKGWNTDVVRIFVDEAQADSTKNSAWPTNSPYVMSGYMSPSEVITGEKSSYSNANATISTYVASSTSTGYMVEYKYFFTNASANAKAGEAIYMEVQAVDHNTSSTSTYNEQHYWNSVTGARADAVSSKAGIGVLSATPATSAIPQMVNGAAIRLDTPTGLRFETRINKAAYDAIAAGTPVKTGTIILPTDYLTDGMAFTKEALDAADIAYIDIVNNGWANAATAETDGYYQFYGSIVNIKSENYGRYFSAISYITIGEGTDAVTIYSDYNAAYHARTVTEVAQAALADTSENWSDDDKAVLNSFIPAQTN